MTTRVSSMRPKRLMVALVVCQLVVATLAFGAMRVTRSDEVACGRASVHAVLPTVAARVASTRVVHRDLHADMTSPLPSAAALEGVSHRMPLGAAPLDGSRDETAVVRRARAPPTAA